LYIWVFNKQVTYINKRIKKKKYSGRTTMLLYLQTRLQITLFLFSMGKGGRPVGEVYSLNGRVILGNYNITIKNAGRNYSNKV
jgi:hypothetical protein